MSPLAKLAFKLCVVGDTGLKTGWVRCRHRAGRGGVGWGGVVTYFADRIGTMLQMLLLSPGNSYSILAVYSCLRTTAQFVSLTQIEVVQHHRYVG